MDYCQAESFLFSLCSRGTKLGLGNVSRMLACMGDVQKNLVFVHIAGTNGKGSVCSILNSIFISAGLKTGVFTSPHLISLRERIKINNRIISLKDFSACAKRIETVVDYVGREYSDRPTFFEAMTAMAVDHFYRNSVDVVLWETGMGGTYDSTNVIDKSISVITNVSLDHCDYLGDTIEQIAKDKAGIIKKKSLFFTASDDENLLKIFKDVCCGQNTEMVVAKPSSIVPKNQTAEAKIFDYRSGKINISNLKTNLIASYQEANIALAIECSKRVFDEIVGNMSEKDFDMVVRKAVRNVKISGRFQVLHKKPLIIVDVAHNSAGMRCLRKAVADRFPNKKINLMFGLLKDKDYGGVCSEAVGFANKIFCVEPICSRKLSAEKLAACCSDLAQRKIEIISDRSIDNVIESFCEKRDNYEILVVCGSFYLVGAVMKMMGKSRIKIFDKGVGYR